MWSEYLLIFISLKYKHGKEHQDHDSESLILILLILVSTELDLAFLTPLHVWFSNFIPCFKILFDLAFKVRNVLTRSSDMALHGGELAQPSEALFAAAPAFSIIEAFCKIHYFREKCINNGGKTKV